MATDYVPAVGNALSDAFVIRTITDPLAYTSYDSKLVTAKYYGQETIAEILGLRDSQVSGKAYLKSWTCGAGDAVGDPVRISAADTVTKALATTAANAQVIGFIR